ncbi:MAG: HEAT repeat domain-containing protein [Euryarchaeota archaeon]|nr:HEAT repeat domain-containing protein [Euryarchaeota archaeon]
MADIEESEIQADVNEQIEALTRLLDDDDRKVRGDAVGILDNIDDARAIKHLITALGDVDAASPAACMLDEIGELAIESLIEALDEDNEQIRENVVHTLGLIGDERAIEPLMNVLGGDVFSDAEWGVQQTAAKALSFIGAPAIEPLINAIEGRNVCLRQGAAWALGGINDEKVVEPLVKALDDDDDGVRQAAAYALGDNYICDERAVEPLVKALEDEDEGVRWAAARTLGGIDDERSIEPLIKALDDECDTVHWNAACALGWSGDERAIKHLIEALGVSEAGVGREAASILCDIFGKPAVEPLIGALKDKNMVVRANAAYALGGIGDDTAVEPLRRLLLDDNNEAVRDAATRSIEAIGQRSK